MSFSHRSGSPVVVNDTDADEVIQITLPNVEVGDGIVIGLAIGNNTSTVSSVDISDEADATPIGSLLSVPGGQRNQLFFLGAATDAGTKTITITLSAFAFAISAFAAAVDASIELDDADETASGETLSMTASVANTCAYALGTDGDAKPSVQSGYIGITMLDVASYTQAQYNLDLGAAGSKTVTLDGVAFQSIIAAIFKPSGGGASVQPTLMLTGVGS